MADTPAKTRSRFKLITGQLSRSSSFSRIIFPALLLSFLPTTGAAQQETPKAAIAGFSADSYRSSTGELMQYRLFAPADYVASQKYPIVLWLHGAAGRGSNNVSQLAGGNFAGSHLWTTPENQAKYHAFVLAPQVDATKGWARPHTNTPPVAIRLALEILDRVEQNYSIDRVREYVVGQSMGGEGVWAALSIAPTRFAAAIALCGYGDAYMIPRVAKVPVWIFQGAEDPLVPVSRAREWVAELQNAGGTPKYTEYPSIGHNAWDVAFKEPELAVWLFSNVRVESDGARPSF
jgi:predicted peptidase